MSMLGKEHFNTFIRLGSTGWLMIALEAWAFDLGQLLAGYTDHVSLGAHASMQTVCGFTYMSFPLALSIAVSIRVGHLLGAGDHLQAQVAARVTILLTLLFMGTLAITYLALRHHVGWIFSGDADVVRTFAAITPIAALFQVFDGLQSACAGVFRGMGRNKVVALLNFFGLWVIGQSLGITLAFFVGTRLGWTGGGGGGGGGGGSNMTQLETHELSAHQLADPPRGIGVYGLWWGLVAGLGCTSVTGLWILKYRTDWVQMAKEAQVNTHTHTHTHTHEQKRPTINRTETYHSKRHLLMRTYLSLFGCVCMCVCVCLSVCLSVCLCVRVCACVPEPFLAIF